MTVAELQIRVERLEEQLTRIEERLNGGSDERHWIEKIRGRWAGDPAYEEAARLGREYRESLRPGEKKKKEKKRKKSK